jgi:hypothetical protein
MWYRICDLYILRHSVVNLVEIVNDHSAAPELCCHQKSGDPLASTSSIVQELKEVIQKL